MEMNAPPPGMSEAEWAVTPVAVQVLLTGLLRVLATLQQHLVQRDEELASLRVQQEAELASLRVQVATLQARLNQHAQNSSKPPSADPPAAPPRPARTPRGRAPGAQKGHPRHDRPDPPPETIDTIRDHYPDTCPCCHDSLADNRHDVCLVQTPFVWDLPIVRPTITAHHYHTVCCRGCGVLVTAPRPPDVPAGAFSARTAAGVAVLRGDYHLSIRAVSHLLQDFFGLPISVGSVVELQQHASTALASIHAALHTAVQQQGRCNVDETGWKENGKRRWLWTMVTAGAIFFKVLTSRDGPGLRAVAGEAYAGIMGSDRHRPYLARDPHRQQFCWSHLIRNLQAVVERKGPEGLWGVDMLALVDVVFRLWHLYREGTLDRTTLQETMALVQARIHQHLEAGMRFWGAPSGMCHELLAHEAALWTFVREEGVEPTNNAAERALRGAVLWRKSSFGAHSAEGNHFVERILSVSATCRLQQRPLLAFLTEAIAAHWAGQPAPLLVPTPLANTP